MKKNAAYKQKRMLYKHRFQQFDPQQTDGSAKGVDEEVKVEAELFYKQTAQCHGYKEGSRDERYLQHVDGVAIAGS